MTPIWRRASSGTGVGLLEAKKQRDGGGLSGGVGAEDGEKFAGTDLEVEAVERDDGAEFLFCSGQFCEIGVVHVAGLLRFREFRHARQNHVSTTANEMPENQEARQK
jgi:hypothetical protein